MKGCSFPLSIVMLKIICATQALATHEFAPGDPCIAVAIEHYDALMQLSEILGRGVTRERELLHIEKIVGQKLTEKGKGPHVSPQVIRKLAKIVKEHADLHADKRAKASESHRLDELRESAKKLEKLFLENIEGVEMPFLNEIVFERFIAQKKTALTSGRGGGRVTAAFYEWVAERNDVGARSKWREEELLQSNALKGCHSIRLTSSGDRLVFKKRVKDGRTVHEIVAFLAFEDNHNYSALERLIESSAALGMPNPCR